METEIQHFHLPTHFLQHSLSFPVLETTKILQTSSINHKNDDLFNFFEEKTSSKNDIGFPVYGMFIHEHIVPGFRYKVRENGTDRWFFDGKAKYLEHVGQGYGKRLTFESNNILENENFFWSDSNPMFGYSFFIEVLFPGDTFIMRDNQIEKFAIVSRVDECQEILTTENTDDEICKKVKVHFEYFLRRKINEDSNNMVSHKAEGVVCAVKRKQQKRFEIREVEIIDRTGGKLLLNPLSMN